MMTDEKAGSKAEEQTMESLLNEETEFRDKLQKKDVVWVKIIQVSKEFVLVNVGEKSEAVIPLSEFSKGDKPTAGKRVPAVLVRRGRGEHPTTLSMTRAKWQLGWEQIAKACKEKTRVKGKIQSAVRGGFLVQVNGVRCFMPSSQTDIRPIRKPKTMIGTGVRCYVLEVNQDKEQIILSRRAVLEEEAKLRKEKLMSQLKVGHVRLGRIMRVSEPGIFIDIGGVEGLIHNENVAWKDIDQVKKKFGRGQKLRIRVLKIDAEKDQVSLGIKQLTPHPADAMRKKYPLKSAVKGTVASIEKEGVRIRLKRGDMAFCIERELATQGGDPTRFNKREVLPAIWPKEGEDITAIVIGVHSVTFEALVSIRRFESIQDRKSAAHYLKKQPPLTLGQLLNPEGD